jgi:hypothetical protein
MENGSIQRQIPFSKTGYEYGVQGKVYDRAQEKDGHTPAHWEAGIQKEMDRLCQAAICFSQNGG